MQELHHNDHYRIRRAVEYYWMNGIPFSDGKRSFQNSTDVLSNISSSSSQNIFKNYLRCSLHYYFNIPKEEHWDLIEKRTHQIISNNFQQEVESLIKIFDIRLKPLQSIGYKEMIAYLHHEIKNKEDLINKIIFSTRQLAKSQRTWFKKIEDKITINPTLNSTESFCLQVYLGLQKAKESFPISLSKELCSWIK
jgi:tRNA dimethylallyltransferase